MCKGAGIPEKCDSIEMSQNSESDRSDWTVTGYFSEFCDQLEGQKQ